MSLFCKYYKQMPSKYFWANLLAECTTLDQDDRYIVGLNFTITIFFSLFRLRPYFFVVHIIVHSTYLCLSLISFNQDSAV